MAEKRAKSRAICKGNSAGCTVRVREYGGDVDRILHNHSYFAVAQKKYVYIYDGEGTEIHCLRHHISPTHLSFLPRHFLLASAVRDGDGDGDYRVKLDGSSIRIHLLDN